MVKASYKNNVEDYKVFTLFTVMIMNRKLTTSLVFIIGGLVAFLISLLGVGFLMVSGMFCFIVGLIHLLVMYIGAKQTANRIIKKSKDFLKIKNEYVFNDTYFTINTEIGKRKEVKDFEYSKIYCVMENKEFFYLFVNNSLAFIVKKSCIEVGTIEELRNIFKSNFDSKKLKFKKNK